MIAYSSGEIATAPHATQLEWQERREGRRLHHKVPMRLKPLEAVMAFDVFLFVCMK